MEYHKNSTGPWRLSEDRFEHRRGTVVYKQRYHDYGLASDDARMFGVEHISVTLNEDGDYPGFTVPISFLGPVE